VCDNGVSRIRSLTLKFQLCAPFFTLINFLIPCSLSLFYHPRHVLRPSPAILDPGPEHTATSSLASEHTTASTLASEHIIAVLFLKS
jgi:hypothetical protein